MLNLLNAVTLDKQQLIIIAGIAAALFVAIIIIIACSVRARKKRQRRDNVKTEVKTAQNDQVLQQEVLQKEIIQNSAVEENDSQFAEKNARQAVEESVDVQTDDDAADNFPRDEKLSEVHVGAYDDANTELVNEEFDDETDDEITDEELEEIAASDDDNAEDVEEEVTVQLAEDGNGEEGIVFRRVRYNRSFLARITQADDEAKERYSELKNYLLSYQKVKSAISWKRESFRIGRLTFADIVMRGKKLCLRFATDPKRFDDTKYKVIDLSIRSPKSKQPCMYRITSERKVRYAKEIIDLIIGELSVEKLAEPATENYVMPYRTTEALIDDGLIKVTVIEGVEKADEAGEVELVKKTVTDAEELPKRDFQIFKKVEVSEVDVMSDAEAANIIEYKVIKRKKSKGSKGIINIDVLSMKFPSGAHITIDVLRERRIIPGNVNYIKVLANGILDKPLIVEADDFSLAAVKMIALTGGRVIRTGDKQ